MPELNIVIALQARSSSTRLPRKVLLPILGEPLLVRELERVRRSRYATSLVVATTNESADDEIAALCHERGIACYRGSSEDVLSRVYHAGLLQEADHLVRLTADCPLVDPELIDATIEHHLAGDFDFTCNCLPPTYPDGLDVEVVRFTAFERAWREATLLSEREHVMPYLYKHPELFKLGSLRAAIDHSDLRWTVDERHDFEVVTAIYEALYPANPAFATADILGFLETHPELRTLNIHHERNEGLARSVSNDTVVERDTRFT